MSAPYHANSLIVFTNNEGKMVVNIRSDGSVEFGDGYTPQESAIVAANAFWMNFGEALKDELARNSVQ